LQDHPARRIDLDPIIPSLFASASSRWRPLTLSMERCMRASSVVTGFDPILAGSIG
jgi:hypothetical protein